ncbi:uncharacterized protein LOC124299297 [Neodiprion virginianus]|uniref:uncharacterized protein LOC124299297 n=1 Tax=Neodiprion virginianus TaxID=2961670 RepID=UPI001EE7404D|nr:uncharacterized protein LOC124299297 [Neodiprion virginianus]
MASFVGLFGFILVACGPSVISAQAIIAGQADRLLSQVNTMVETVNHDAATYKTELQGLFDELSETTASNLETIDGAVKEFNDNFEAALASLVHTVHPSEDVNSCTSLADPLRLRSDAILEESDSCMKREVTQASAEKAITEVYVNSQLSTLDHMQSMAQNCMTSYENSEQTTSDASQAFACVQIIHMSVSSLVVRFELVIDIAVSRSLYDGYQSRVAACANTASSGITALIADSEIVYENIDACLRA